MKLRPYSNKIGIKVSRVPRINNGLRRGMLLRRSEVLVLILLYCNSAPIGCFRWNVISSRARCFSGFRSWRRSVERGCGDEEVEVVFVDADEADTLREQSGRIEKPEVTYSVNDNYQIEQTRLATLVKEWENQKGTDDGMGSDELAAEAQLDALAAELFAADEGFTQEFLGDTLSSSTSPESLGSVMWLSLRVLLDIKIESDQC